MLRFFRKIRQRLLTENRFSKYLLYAIGEIVLVVIGILIALQVNNWNQERINMDGADQFLRRLTLETDINFIKVDEAINREKTSMNCIETILGYFHMARAAIDLDTLDSLIYTIIAPSELDINLATLNEGLNTGVMEYVKSDSLKNLVYGLPSRPAKIRYYENFILEDNVNNLIPFLYEHYNFRNMDSKFSPVKERIGYSAFPVSGNLKVFDQLKFENLLDNQMYNYSTKLNQYTEFKNELELLKVLIKRELEDD